MGRVREGSRKLREQRGVKVAKGSEGSKGGPIGSISILGCMVSTSYGQGQGRIKEVKGAKGSEGEQREQKHFYTRF